jgi:hypothetical protein
MMIHPSSEQVADFRIHAFGLAYGVMSDTSKIEPLMRCPHCMTEMRLFGIEAESEGHDIYSFVCLRCGSLEVRTVLVTAPYSELVCQTWN